MLFNIVENALRKQGLMQNAFALTERSNNNFIVSSEIYRLLTDPIELRASSVVVKGVSNPLTVHLMGKPFKSLNNISRSLRHESDGG